MVANLAKKEVVKTVSYVSGAGAMNPAIKTDIER